LWRGLVGSYGLPYPPIFVWENYDFSANLTTRSTWNKNIPDRNGELSVENRKKIDIQT
jgi:hypothetical protein